LVNLLARKNPDDPSPLGWLTYRFVHAPLGALKTRNADFLLYLLLGRRVCGGPFAGLRYVGSSPNSHIGDALLGTLEKEVQPFLQSMLARTFDVFINVGGAEGYYAVGVARFSAVPRVIAFESDRFGRVLIRYMARRNRVADKLDVRGHCDPSALAAAMAPYSQPALLVDIEGFEKDVLDPTINPHLKRSTIIVELHETDAPMAEILRPRFASTHHIEEVWSQPRTLADLPNIPALAGLAFSRDRLVRFMDERRGRAMRWWLLSPRPAS
jgi:hypothetical protein